MSVSKIGMADESEIIRKEAAVVWCRYHPRIYLVDCRNSQETSEKLAHVERPRF
jgi:hypothetical protein